MRCCVKYSCVCTRMCVIHMDSVQVLIRVIFFSKVDFMACVCTMRQYKLLRSRLPQTL